jgi:hypothetical protein
MLNAATFDELRVKVTEAYRMIVPLPVGTDEGDGIPSSSSKLTDACGEPVKRGPGRPRKQQ